MEVTIENGFLVARIPVGTPRESKSGKNLVVASSGGNMVTSAKVDGKPVIVGLNAYIKP